MRAYVPGYEMVSPGSLDGVLQLLADRPGVYKPFAGGTEIMVLYNAGHQQHKNYVNIWGLPELSGIEVSDTEVRIGALATYTEVRHHPVLKEEFPMLCQAASESGAIAIQNRGTVGGNIANASPAADTPPALLAYGAEIELLAKSGTRRFDYADFHQGYKVMDLAAEELIGSVYLRRLPGRFHYYRKVGTRKAQAISKVCIAASGTVEAGRVAGLTIALGAVAPTVCRPAKTLEFLRNREVSDQSQQTLNTLREKLLEDISPIDDIRSNKEYRAQVAANLVVDFWQSLS